MRVGVGKGQERNHDGGSPLPFLEDSCQSCPRRPAPIGEKLRTGDVAEFGDSGSGIHIQFDILLLGKHAYAVFGEFPL